MASNTEDLQHAIARLGAEASSTDDNVRRAASLQLSLLRRVANPAPSLGSLGRYQNAFAGEAKAPTFNLTMQDRSSRDPPSSTPTRIADAESDGPPTDHTTKLPVKIGRKRQSKAITGNSTTSPSTDRPQKRSNAALISKRLLPTLSVEGVDPYINGGWSAMDWMENVWDRSNVKQIDILCRLGLVAPGAKLKNYKGHWNFDDPILAELSTAIHDLSKTFHDESFDQTPAGTLGRNRGKQGRKLHDDGRNAFLEAACNPVHMNNELNDLLFDRFGSKVWGMDVAAREGCTYRLELENDEDRPKIEALLHLWVFVKIANKCRDNRRKLSSAAKAQEQSATKDDETVDEDISDSVDPQAVERDTVEDEETADVVDDEDQADLTAAKDHKRVEPTQRLKRNREAKETTALAPISGDTDDVDPTDTPFQKKRRTTGTFASAGSIGPTVQDSEHVTEGNKVTDAVSDNNRTELVTTPCDQSEPTAAGSDANSDEPTTTTVTTQPSPTT